jgi:hypothetical protein
MHRIHIRTFYTQLLSSLALPTNTNKHIYVVMLGSSFLTHTNKHTTYTQVHNKHSKQVKGYRYSYVIGKLKYRPTTFLLRIKLSRYFNLVFCYLFWFS